jgi:hypothetical protein
MEKLTRPTNPGEAVELNELDLEIVAGGKDPDFGGSMPAGRTPSQGFRNGSRGRVTF